MAAAPRADVPAAVAAAAADEEELSIPRFASPSERRAIMAERRERLLRAAREEAERTADGGAANAQKAAAEPAAAPATDLRSMLQSLQSQTKVRPAYSDQRTAE